MYSREARSLSTYQRNGLAACGSLKDPTWHGLDRRTRCWQWQIPGSIPRQVKAACNTPNMNLMHKSGQRLAASTMLLQLKNQSSVIFFFNFFLNFSNKEKRDGSVS